METTRGRAEFGELVAGYRANGTSNLRAAIAIRESGNPKIRLGYALFDIDGNRVGGALVTPRPALGWQHINFIDPIDGADRARAFALDLSDGTRLLVAADSDALEQIDGTILWIFSLAFLTALVTELCEMYTPAIDEGGRRFSWTGQPNIAIDGDRELISQAFINLVNNAHVHTPIDPAMGLNMVAAIATVHRARLVFDDNAPGLIVMLIFPRMDP